MRHLHRYTKNGLDLIVDTNERMIYGWKTGYGNMCQSTAKDHVKNRYNRYYRKRPEERKEGQYRTTGGWQTIALIEIPVLLNWLHKEEKYKIVKRILSLDIDEVIREVHADDSL